MRLIMTERRESSRADLSLPGILFLMDSEKTTDCVVTDLSVSGAGIAIEGHVNNGAAVVLYVGDFIRFEGTITNNREGSAGVSFSNSGTALSKFIAALAHRFLSHAPNTRLHVRSACVATGYFAISTGERLECEILDLSVSGMSIATKFRPAIGSIIELGRLAGEVVRHHAQGIGVSFLDVNDLVSDHALTLLDTFQALSVGDCDRFPGQSVNRPSFGAHGAETLADVSEDCALKARLCH